MRWACTAKQVHIAQTTPPTNTPFVGLSVPASVRPLSPVRGRARAREARTDSNANQQWRRVGGHQVNHFLENRLKIGSRRPHAGRGSTQVRTLRRLPPLLPTVLSLPSPPSRDSSARRAPAPLDSWNRPHESCPSLTTGKAPCGPTDRPRDDGQRWEIAPGRS